MTRWVIHRTGFRRWEARRAHGPVSVVGVAALVVGSGVVAALVPRLTVAARTHSGVVVLAVAGAVTLAAGLRCLR